MTDEETIIDLLARARQLQSEAHSLIVAAKQLMKKNAGIKRSIARKQSHRPEALGHVSQEGSTQELPNATEPVHLGKSSTSPILAGDVVHAKPTREIPARNGAASLSIREREVLFRIARGQTSKDIAREFHVSVRTIQTHRERMMRKLNIHTIAGLTRYALTASLDEAR